LPDCIPENFPHGNVSINKINERRQLLPFAVVVVFFYIVYYMICLASIYLISIWFYLILLTCQMHTWLYVIANDR